MGNHQEGEPVPQPRGFIIFKNEELQRTIEDTPVRDLVEGVNKETAVLVAYDLQGTNPNKAKEFLKAAARRHGALNVSVQAWQLANDTSGRLPEGSAESFSKFVETTVADIQGQ